MNAKVSQPVDDAQLLVCETSAEWRVRKREIDKQVVLREKKMTEAGDAFEKAMWAERKAGELGIAKKDLADFSTLTNADREHLVWRANMFRDVPEEQFSAWLKEARRSEKLYTNWIRDKAEEFVEAKKKAARVLLPLGIEGAELYVADIYQVKTLRLGEFASAVITDPPYRESDTHLWGELVRFSGRFLRDHGWLIAMSGQRFLPKVFAEMQSAAEKAGLRYAHVIGVQNAPGGQSAQVWISERNPVNSDWKPVIVYSKGEPANWPDGFRDWIVSERNEKEHHEWQQNLGVFGKLVEKFSQPKDLIVDPFLGGGTTAIAAHELGRAVEGFDILEKHVIESIERLKRPKQAVIEVAACAQTGT